MSENTLVRTPLHTAGHRDIVAFASEPVTGTHLLEAAYGGKVRFAKVREAGTLRSWPVLKPGSSERKSAENFSKAVAGGTPVAALAKEANVSVATLRRTLTSLAFTQSLEQATAKERAAIAKAASANKPEPKAEKAPKEPKAEAKPEPKAPKASTPKPPVKVGKGGFVPTTKAAKAAAARKALKAAQATTPEPKDEAIAS